MYFDTHTHLLDDKFDGDRIAIIGNFKEDDIAGVLECATDLETSKRAVELAERFDSIYAAVGVHPHDAKTWNDNALPLLTELIKSKKVRAIGEIGLDYHYDFSPRDEQLKVFEAQMNFAHRNDLPVIIHSREAFADTLSVIKNFPRAKGIWHSFTGSKEIMEEALKYNYFIAFGGVTTFKNAKKPCAAAEAVPMDRFLLETDCPYMTPAPYRGRRNEPKYVKYVAQKISELKKTDLKEIEEAALKNTQKALGILV